MTRRGDCVINSRGVLWFVNTNSKNLKYFAGHPYAEEEIISKFCDFCKMINPEYFIDIGANFGFYSVLVPRRMESIKRIFCFEPVKEVRDVLYANIAVNKMGDMSEISPAAVSDKSGVSEMLIDPSGDSVSTLPETVMAQRYASGYTQKQTVHLARLDELFNFSSKTCAIKIDVEGNECRVLAGGINFLSRNNCILQVECFHENREKLTQIMDGINYKEIGEVRHHDRSDIWLAR